MRMGWPTLPPGPIRSAYETLEQEVQQQGARLSAKDARSAANCLYHFVCLMRSPDNGANPPVTHDVWGGGVCVCMGGSHLRRVFRDTGIARDVSRRHPPPRCGSPDADRDRLGPGPGGGHVEAHATTGAVGTEPPAGGPHRALTHAASDQ